MRFERLAEFDASILVEARRSTLVQLKSKFYAAHFMSFCTPLYSLGLYLLTL